jgi:peptide/nickel transport system permease protein
MKENPILNALKSFGRTLASLFTFGKKEIPVFNLSEEAILSPTKVIVRNFKRNKLAMFGLVWFVAMIVVVFGGSALFPIDLYETEPVLRNTQPGSGYTAFPSVLNDVGVETISTGITYSVALAGNGDVYTWGVDVNNVLSVPKEIASESPVKVVSGDRHVLALTSGGKVYAWGNNNFNQGSVPFEISSILNLESAVDIFAGDQYSGILTNKGKLYVWGSTLATRLDIVPKEFQGNISKAAASSFNILLLDKNGKVGIMGQSGTPLETAMPEYLKDGSVQLVDITVTLRTAAGIDKNGKIYVWGENFNDLLKLPEGIENAKITQIAAGRAHFMAIDSEGKLYTWGSNKYKQATIPNALVNEKVTYISAGFYQSYAVTESGKVYSWGNNGFLLGSDEFGRDLALRLLHGGRVTMTVGAVAVLISTFIGLLVGLIAGFYGKWVDNLLMRFAEVISSFPFLPLAITLSSFLQGYLTQTQKLLMIMIILGVISWPGLARLIRGQILAEREKDFVLAARALGIRSNTIILRHILPNIINIVIVSMTLSYAGSLLTEAGLSFLGFGVVPPSPSWGNMLSGAQQSDVIQLYWWRWILPAVCVLIAALSVNIVGDGLRDAMDPKANEK